VVGAGVDVFGNVTGVAVATKGAGVDVFGNVTGVAVATKGAGVTVGIPAMAVATRSFTICSTSASDGPKEQATAAAETKTTRSNQRKRISPL
jgi:hypothetical protein|tara:strand:- start:161 stop:436 length:276 start_codon:yes stop_codon:yes gene_type:complete